MRIFNLLAFAIIFGLINQNVSARFFRVKQIPNGSKYQCSNCHINPGGSGTRTPFGETVFDNLDEPISKAKVRWDLIFNIDSDGDGFTNGEELLDPDGQWVEFDDDLGDQQDVSKPWDPSSVPSTSSIENEYANRNTVAYPIPTNGIVNIEFPSNYFENTKIEFFDLSGNNIKSMEINSNVGSNKFTFDFRKQNLSYGAYIVTIRNKYYFIRKKLVYTN